MISVSAMKISATVAIEKKMPRSRSVISPVPKPSSPLTAAPARICAASGAPVALIATTAVYAPRPKNAAVPKLT